MINIRKLILQAGLSVCFLPVTLYSYEITDTAFQFSKGQIRAVISYSEFSRNSLLQIGSQNEITVKSGTNEFKYFSYSEQSISCSCSGKETSVKFVLNPFDELFWWIKAGTSGITFEIPSTAGWNKLNSLSDSTGVGLGAKYQVFPETIVTPGIAIDLGVMRWEYKLDKYYPADSVGGSSGMIINNRLEELQYQMTFLVSKMFSFQYTAGATLKKKLDIEPYGGFKIMRHYVKLTDRTTMTYADGFTYNYGLFIGARVKLYPVEWLIFELSLLDERIFTLGFGWGF